MEFLQPFGITTTQLARDTKTPARRWRDVIRGRRPLSADAALRLSKYFGNSAAFWLNLQVRYDLEIAKDELGDRLDYEVTAFVSDN